jgi:hypothetical protein
MGVRSNHRTTRRPWETRRKPAYLTHTHAHAQRTGRCYATRAHARRSLRDAAAMAGRAAGRSSVVMMVVTVVGGDALQAAYSFYAWLLVVGAGGRSWSLDTRPPDLPHSIKGHGRGVPEPAGS